MAKILLAAALAVVLYTGWALGQALYHYNLFSKSAPIKIASWEVREIEEGTFAVVAAFSFRQARCEYVFQKPFFSNRFIATEHIKGWEKEAWTLYFHPSKNLYSLQKLFPFLPAIHFVLALGVFVYFINLIVYSGRFAIK